MKGAELADIGKYCIHERNVKSLNKCNSLTLLSFIFKQADVSESLQKEVLGLDLHLNTFMMRNM